ncbi:hypothetical protein BMF35_a2231 [Aurantiacibacter gangjinensis]|nr:SnoaL-like domain-containing protein [Aurantiacibacter gangjinensis]APE29060.1 hypothetical protein BMF35_a2231 [Aurantiacibacter gangjinensis]
MSHLQGRQALLEKHAWWEANTEVHDEKMEGPFVNGDEFAINYHMDVTMEGERHKMSETGVYTVRDGKVAEERFFYAQ